ncbi:MAG: ATP-binding protein, partial [Verrucomicrobia bacterium]|nr:ATP-binding protein [Verrucomicrobiota bacterium]
AREAAASKGLSARRLINTSVNRGGPDCQQCSQNSHAMNLIDPREISRMLKRLSAEEQRAAWYLQALTVEDNEQEASWFYSRDLGCRPFIPFTDPPPKCIARMLQVGTEAEESYYKTNIGRMVWETLDFCRRERRCAVIQGEPGRGKSATCQAFYEAHRGQVRVCRVPPYPTQSDFFRRLARSIGLPYAGVSPSDIRIAIIDIFSHADLILVLDEAQCLLPVRGLKRRPLFLEWIMDLVDQRVCIALVGTDDFASRVAAVESSNWTVEQFKRRFMARFTALPDHTEDTHLENLAARFFPHVERNSKAFAAAVEYARGIRDVAGLVELLRDSKAVALAAGRTEVTGQDIEDAMKQVRLVNDVAMDRAFVPPQNVRWQSADAGQEDCGDAAVPLQVVSSMPADRELEARDLPAHLRNRFDLAVATLPARR